MAGDLWCQESYCTIDNLPYILDYGESVGDMHISKCVAVLRTSAIYEATRQDDEKILLKIAHQGFEERLIREARFLKHLQTQDIYHPMLLKLLSAHVQSTVEEFPYGRTVYQRRPLSYAVFEHVDGDILREMLLKNPQPWYQHAAWLVMSLVDVMALLHDQGVLHLGLCPESLLVRYDAEKIIRPVLMDLGSVTEVKDFDEMWNSHYVPPAYIAPELLDYPRQPSLQADIYGVGLIFYELLAGRPAHEFRMRRDQDILDAIRSNLIAPINRPDLKKEALDVVHRAMSKSAKSRFPDFETMGKELLDIFPSMPPEVPPRKINWNTIGIVVLVVFFIVLLLTTALFLSGS